MFLNEIIKLAGAFKKRKILIGIVSLIIIGVIGTLFLTSSISDKIPKLYVSSESMTIETLQGGYSWRIGTFSPKYEIADTLHPTQFKYNEKSSFTAVTGEQLIMSNRKVKIDRESEKKSFTINWYNSDGTSVSSENIISDFGNAVKNVIYFLTPQIAGDYICSVQVEYKHGKVQYGFKVIVND